MQNKTKPTSNQDVFNRVWQHFVVEGNPRCIDIDSCKYRANQNGEINGCAIGCMLPDKLYFPSMEGNSYNNLPKEPDEKYQLIVKWFSNCTTDFLARLQMAHDVEHPDPSIANRLRELAESYKLNVPS